MSSTSLTAVLLGRDGRFRYPIAAWLAGVLMTIAGFSLFTFGDAKGGGLGGNSPIQSNGDCTETTHMISVRRNSPENDDTRKLRAERDGLARESERLRTHVKELQSELEDAKVSIRALDARTDAENLIEEIAPSGRMRVLNNARTDARVRADRAWRLHELTKFVGSERTAIAIMRMVHRGRRLEAGNFQDLVDVAGIEVAKRISMALEECPPIPGTVPGVDSSREFFDFFEKRGMKFLDSLAVFVANYRRPIASVSGEDHEARIQHERFAAENLFERKEVK